TTMTNLFRPQGAFGWFSYTTSRDTIFEYQCFPTLDLIAPDVALLQQAANAIERLRAQGPLLVCCALGYSRSASAVAAWLLLSGRCSDAQQAEALIRKARPGIVLHPAHRLALQQLGALP
ncbi:dual specificity protein phosphatase family protein, partial [Pseudomonas putida]|uniref:dual specificity protein phosphatase family protein n=1 Tax=Pseudomonas putida TaxID=303 RepID=UPI0024E149B2